jgi:hypothetical protein
MDTPLFSGHLGAFDSLSHLKGHFAIFYMLAKYVSDDIKYIFTMFYRHISTNNEAKRKFKICALLRYLWKYVDKTL